MAKKGKRRGSGGHPAKVAAARERERVAREQSDTAIQLARLARRLADEAAELGSPLDAELWAAELVGSFWAAWAGLTLEEAEEVDDPGLAFGAPLLELLARTDDAGAAVAIKALAVLDDGELGLLARGVLEDQHLEARLPEWAADIGELTITQAAVVRERVFDDSVSVMLEARHPDGERLAVSVEINHNHGGLAVDALAIESIDGVAQHLDRDGDGDGDGEDELEEFGLEPIDVGQAAELIEAAISETDAIWDPPVTEEYWAARALALVFAAETPRSRVRPEPAPIGESERRALLEAFRAAPESDGLGLELEEVRVVTLAIEYAVDFVGRDALRWSPEAVDAFMLDWAPMEPGVTAATLAVMPAVMDGWVRFCGARRGTPEAAIARTRETVAELSVLD